MREELVKKENSLNQLVTTEAVAGELPVTEEED